MIKPVRSSLKEKNDFSVCMLPIFMEIIALVLKSQIKNNKFL